MRLKGGRSYFNKFIEVQGGRRNLFVLFDKSLIVLNKLLSILHYFIVEINI